MPPNALAQAREWAAATSRLLNQTIADGQRLSVVDYTAGGQVWVAKGITESDLERSSIPLSLGTKPGLWLDVFYRFVLDPEGRWLTVAKSEVAVMSDSDMTNPIIRYDYTREPGNDYPEAHLHVYGSLDGEISDVDNPANRLHLPVGPRRFRPSVEDVVMFLVTERLVAARDGWRQAVEDRRRAFYTTQLRAAARRDPEVAMEGIEQAK